LKTADFTNPSLVWRP